MTFTLTTTGTLAITAPTATVDLGSGGTVGTNIGSAGDFGAVTVTDNRALDPAAWIATVSSTDFTNTTTSADVILADDAAYRVGDIRGDFALGLAYFIDLSNSAQAVVTQSGYDGDNAATWTPTILHMGPGHRGHWHLRRHYHAFRQLTSGRIVRRLPDALMVAAAARTAATTARSGRGHTRSAGTRRLLAGILLVLLLVAGLAVCLIRPNRRSSPGPGQLDLMPPRPLVRH